MGLFTDVWSVSCLCVEMFILLPNYCNLHFAFLIWEPELDLILFSGGWCICRVYKFNLQELLVKLFPKMFWLH